MSGAGDTFGPCYHGVHWEHCTARCQRCGHLCPDHDTSSNGHGACFQSDGKGDPCGCKGYRDNEIQRGVR